MPINPEAKRRHQHNKNLRDASFAQDIQTDTHQAPITQTWRKTAGGRSLILRVDFSTADEAANSEARKAVRALIFPAKEVNGTQIHGSVIDSPNVFFVQSSNGAVTLTVEQAVPAVMPA